MNSYSTGYREAFNRLGFSLAPHHAATAEELAAAEKRLRITVPASLKAYYRTAGREVALNGAHNRLLLPDEWDVSDQKLVFLEENQGVVVWSVDVSLHADDPPVFQGSPDLSEWYPEHPLLSQFLQAMLHWQAVMGSALPCSGSAELDGSVRARLDQACTFSGEISELRAYSRDRVALCLVPWDQRHRLFVAGPSEEVVAQVLAAVGCNWDEEFDQA